MNGQNSYSEGQARNRRQVINKAQPLIASRIRRVFSESKKIAVYKVESVIRYGPNKKIGVLENLYLATRSLIKKHERPKKYIAVLRLFLLGEYHKGYHE
ncbi:hypothetical protein FUAX_27520 [Fulvitalea axinellae]|uniref:Transposase n=1 Tax=Fulvitalea axinellae TaxID=1182444 RepID=A0AAU9DD21_9BACT|nr:hypothetical protein FUAX_27520 [Fulvitalea axinellae]